MTEVQFNDALSTVNLNMRVTGIPLPFPYQYTDESVTYKILWVSIFYSKFNCIKYFYI